MRIGVGIGILLEVHFYYWRVTFGVVIRRYCEIAGIVFDRERT